MERVSLLKVDTYQDNLRERIIELLTPLGGLESFCKSGSKVLLKPNLIMAHPVAQAATTHPAIILAMASLLKDLGCRVAVGDSPGFGSAKAVFRKQGLDVELKRFGAELTEFEHSLPVSSFKSQLNFERRFKSLTLAGELTEYDHLINLAKFKSHGQMGITLATKNLYGCVVGAEKGRWHFTAGRDLRAFARLLLEVALTVNADLHIIDGIVGMDGNGPSNGRAREFKLLLAGANPIAVDRVGVELTGYGPEQFPLFAAAGELGCSGLSLSEVELSGTPLADLKISDFQLPISRGLTRLLSNNPIINRIAGRLIRARLNLDPKLCINCRKCEELCPAKAIGYSSKITISEQKCIKCCCCQELCPVGALSLEDPWLIKLLHKIGIK